MKFFSYRVFLLGLALSGPTLASPSLYTGLKIEELEKLEYDRPDDPDLKMELARQYWCLGIRGMAVEHWLWVKRSTRGNHTLAASGRLDQMIRSPALLKQELCSNLYPQKTL